MPKNNFSDIVLGVGIVYLLLFAVRVICFYSGEMEATKSEVSIWVTIAAVIIVTGAIAQAEKKSPVKAPRPNFVGCPHEENEDN